MKHASRLVALAACISFAPAKLLAAPAGPTFPGNEATHIEGGTQRVELPPLSKAAQGFVRAGGKGTKPVGQSEVYMIETKAGLVECSLPFFSESACAPSTLGQVKRNRFWTVKLAGAWVHCSARSQPRTCEAAQAGVPSAMSSVE